VVTEHQSVQCLSYLSPPRSISYPTRRSSDLTIDLGVTVYPIPFLGVRVGGRYLEYDIRSKDSDDPKDSFDLDLEYLGATLSIIRSEEHTSELQSRENLVCRLLLEKKKLYQCT